MTLAMFKLESFSAANAARTPEPLYDQGAVDEAFARGLTEGLARKDDEQLRTLGAGLERLARALADDAMRRAALRDEAVSALAPILEAILDNLMPASESRRIETALRDELGRLAQMAQPLRAKIACGSRLRAMVERCLAEQGLEAIEITEGDSDRISLSLQGGRIEFSPEQVALDIRALISELKEDDTTWTH